MSATSISPERQLTSVLATLNSLMSLSTREQERLQEAMQAAGNAANGGVKEAPKKQAVSSSSSGAATRSCSSTSSYFDFDSIVTEATDARNLALPQRLRPLVADRDQLLHQFPPYFFHSVNKLRETVVSVSLNYYGIERVQ
ncbi:unnamed protein product, partial [Amoebophrya sp. A25]|eukprot:GSA25T00012201001.1